MTCDTLKTGYETRDAADRVARHIQRRKRSRKRVADNQRTPQGVTVYRCPLCSMWHLGRSFR